MTGICCHFCFCCGFTSHSPGTSVCGLEKLRKKNALFIDLNLRQPRAGHRLTFPSIDQTWDGDANSTAFSKWTL